MNLRNSPTFLAPPLLGVVILFFASCGENVLGPFDDTTYVLESIDGAALPATVADEFGGLAWVVTADTIWLESGSGWRRRSVQRREEGVGGDPLDVDVSGSVAWFAGVIVLEFECDDADCIAPDRIVPSDAGFEMERTYLHSGRRLVFRRI